MQTLRTDDVDVGHRNIVNRIKNVIRLIKENLVRLILRRESRGNFLLTGTNAN